MLCCAVLCCAVLCCFAVLVLVSGPATGVERCVCVSAFTPCTPRLPSPSLPPILCLLLTWQRCRFFEVAFHNIALTLPSCVGRLAARLVAGGYREFSSLKGMCDLLLLLLLMPLLLMLPLLLGSNSYERLAY